jgi:hypothetical protein
MKTLLLAVLPFQLTSFMTAQVHFGQIRGEGQIFAAGTNSAIRDASGPYQSLLRALIWPSLAEGASRERPISAIPGEVVTQGTNWTRRIVQPELLPANLSARWRGLEQFNGSDCLCFRYRDGDRRVQIVEDGSSVAVVVSAANNAPRDLSASQARNLIKSTANSILILPPAPKPEIVLQSRPISRGTATLWYGYAKLGQQKDAREWEWWSNFTVVTDGSTVAFILPENTPSVGAPFGGATSSTGKRFGGSG